MLSYAAFPFFAFLLVLSPAAGANETVKTWAAKLLSDRPSEWRIAQAYLAHAGARALPTLAKLADGPGAAPKQRLKETLSLMLRNAAGPESIRKYPKLWALGEPEL